MDCLKKFTTPQLELIHSGKVRDSFRIDNDRRLIVVTDRISAFDKNLSVAIPFKGAVLNGISNYWFNKTGDIIDNHFIKAIDQNINIVKETQPVKLEMIVRGYLTGSMWRGYQKGKRAFSGVKVDDGLTKNQKFPKPIITPTTKEDNDREITPDNILKEGLVTEDIYNKMAEVSLKLFERGTKILEEKGIILVDTKYEFGIHNGNLILIDEIHTPDSSRFWYAEDYNNNPEQVEQIDKEYIRQWVLNNKDTNSKTIPDSVVKETSRRYLEIYSLIMDEEMDILKHQNIKSRVYKNLSKSELIKSGYIAIIMGSPSDIEHCNKIKSYLDKYDVMVDMRVVSAHKNGEEIVKFADEYNNSIDPGVVIAVAGRSNGLGGALAANLNIPVINCPPFKDNLDLMTNINSSLIMPSKTPAMTVVHPDNAAYGALRALNIPSIREQISIDIQKLKSNLVESDRKIRGK